MSEHGQKEQRVRELLAGRGLDALLLRRVSSFAWATGGAASHINIATDYGEGALLYTPSGRYLVANNIETPRLLHEEGLEAQGWEPVGDRWYESGDAVGSLTEGLALASDCPYPGATDVSQDMAQMRAHLTPEEGDRLREIGRLCGEAMNAAIRRISPGQSEYEIAAALSAEAYSRGVLPIVDLVATDERIYQYRHPLPTDKKVDRYAMLVLCGRRHGLVCSITRLVHFGPLPDELRRKQEAVLKVDATFLEATRPGVSLRGVFARAVEAYAQSGFPDEWQRHHQGGAAGYEPREYLGTPEADQVVAEGQAFAWNPSITGVKAEDTILVGPEENEVLTRIPDWPAISVDLDGQTYERPAVLEL